MAKKEWEAFVEIFGITPKNRIIEFFLEMRELDFSIGDVANETGLSRATTYNTAKELIKNKIILPTRKLRGIQLYRLNLKKPEVQVLIRAFNEVLSVIEGRYQEKEMVVLQQG
ncbi:hypothetical protein HYV88_04960 [Candidatus Woesearchaeota archaeon]|nr:hypothetical protein [Candidatus Woesearchaeota archaeon]